jgi:hypothetical protein
MHLMKNNRNMYIAGAVIVVLLLLGGYMVLGKNTSAKPEETSAVEEEQQVQKADPKDYGLTVSFRKDTHAIKFSLSNLKDIKHIEYQIPYKHDTADGEVSEALFGEADTEGKPTYETDYRLFGTASSGVERFHEVKYPVQLTLKLTKNDGSILQVEQEIKEP